MTVSENLSATFKAVLEEAAVEQILAVARREPETPNTVPHCTHDHDDGGEYVYEPPEWWTSGFFPGSIWTILERYYKTGGKTPAHIDVKEVEQLANKWADVIKSQKTNTETHDIGFMIMPAFQRMYELKNKSPEAAKTIVTAAVSLLTRWNDKAQCFKSWNTTRTKKYHYNNDNADLLVIIDNMMNLDLLYSASLITGDQKYADHATRHAETTIQSHIRDDWSTYHLVVFDTQTGVRKIGLTAQGYANESVWSRGQAWGLYGFATVYRYTKDKKFLDVAKKLTDKFLQHVGENGEVYWDFDCPDNKDPKDWDVSAATIACSGMLQICQLENSTVYLDPVAKILSAVQKHARTAKSADAVLKHSTVNRAPSAAMCVSQDSGLCYADYYYLELGNRLLDMKLV
ncbi:hypothetical protein TRICI_005141 [Trichomonascus ciferrii]|uniref:Unsaturated glucuronyl hydrolase n=1 Tax=Trichomonascus ciferrii TaxID=44093 RepID=A0A642UXL4_9ASCO|nr:hypothetical protein TRICI_005141 [Trichomonascus ciferrii]